MTKQCLQTAAFLIMCFTFSQKAMTQDTIKTQGSVIVDKPDSSKSPTDKPFATIFIYRPRNFTGAAISYNIRLNDSVICRIKNNTKYEIKVYKEGPAEISAETEQKRKVNINVKFGEQYYLKCGITMGVMVGRPEINLIYPEQGRLDYENLDAKNTQSKNKD